MGLNAPRRRETTDGHLSGAQAAGGKLVLVDPVREDTSASAFPATQPLYKTCIDHAFTQRTEPSPQKGKHRDDGKGED
jgi:hypothetical protein